MYTNDYFQYENDDQAREYLKGLVGKKITTMVTGMEVEAEVTSFEETKYGFELRGTHEPVNWGGEYFTKLFIFVRKGDGFGGKYIKPKMVEIIVGDIYFQYEDEMGNTLRSNQVEAHLSEGCYTKWFWTAEEAEQWAEDNNMDYVVPSKFNGYIIY